MPRRRLLRLLVDPETYPARPERVELRETHISWVALAGDRAYKVKKPVVLPFVDYGTAARRRAMCVEELRVNRRLAPDVYVGVVALVPRDGGLRLGPVGAPDAVEHAVEMRRYDEEETLARTAATPEQLEALGALLARFHAQAAPAPGAATPEEVAAETLESLRALEAPDLGDVVRAGLRATAQERAGRPAVDGHGDLRAEHVLLRDPPVVVDALEFDPALRAGDRAYDLAFLLMDLLRADPSGGLGAAVLEGYGDAGSRRLRATYIVLRALVRAKVDLLRAGQLRGTAAHERRERGLGLVDLADRVAWDIRLPEVVCVTGLSASGKSTVARALAAASGRDVLSSDALRTPGAYGSAERTAVYAALGRRADRPVIVDATFLRAEDVEAFTSTCTRETGWIVCRAPTDVLLRRAARPREHGSEAGPDVVRAQLQAAPAGPQPPVAPLAVLDTTRPVDELLEQLRALQPA